LLPSEIANTVTRPEQVAEEIPYLFAATGQ